MFSLWKKDPDRSAPLIDPDTYAKLLNRISERDTEIASLKSKVAALEVDFAHLRGKLTTKLKDLRKEFEEETEKDLSDNTVYM